MKITILKWVLQYALRALTGYLDPAEQARVDEYNQKRDELVKKETEAKAVIAAAEADISYLEQTQQDRKAKIAQAGYDIDQLDVRLKEIQDEKDRRHAELDALGDDAVLHSKL